MVQADARLQSRHHRQPPNADSGLDVVFWSVDDRVGRYRNEDLRPLRRVGSYKLLRHHTNHGERNVGDNQLPPYDIRSTIEPPRPKMFADHHCKSRRTATFLIVFRCQVPANQRRRLKTLEELAAYQHPANVLVSRTSL